MIHPMRLYEDTDVRGIYAACHPGWPARAPRWFEAHPTLVLEVERAIVGYTSYSIGLPPGPNPTEFEIQWGHGVYVRPDARGRGYGRHLCDARLAVARALGLRTFFGMTQPDNHAMIHLFEQDGLKCYGEAPNAYPDGSAGVFYFGRV